MVFYYLVTALIVLFTAVIVRGSADSMEKYDENSLKSEVVGLLNATYFNINEKVCELQRRVDAIEGGTHSGQQCGCNSTEIQEFKRTVSTEINDFSKILSGFENELRTMKKEQNEIREHLGGEVISSTTMSTTEALECDKGWILSPGGKCYYVSLEKAQWATAIDQCISKSAKLVEFQTDEEAQFVMRNLPSRITTQHIIYTGRKRNSKNVWVFLSDDRPVDTTRRSWHPDQPDGGQQSCGCIGLTYDFLMLDCFCRGYDLYYICETMAGAAPTPTTPTTTPPPTITSAATTSKSLDCKDGWIESQEKCYYVSTRSEATDWATAINRCKSIGANLVEIKTDKEALFIARNLPSRIGDDDLFYTGRERKSSFDWFFISDNEMVDTTVRSWAVGEPSNTGSQTCGCAKSEDNFKMHDCVCMGFSVLYICEIRR
ncbi:low affinity immunoglobulin epsilon Fc receptor-like [Argopecten irradians]|uniref:low affinity immunoglobulin epsilon Fc receptor-like n=1 Tax=Argopecten irradians TaxID=31199 RepID=UPI003720FB2A